MKLLVLTVIFAVVLVEVSATQYLSKLVLNGELTEVLHNAQCLLRSRIMMDQHFRFVQASKAKLYLEDMFFHISDDTTAELCNLTLFSTADLSLESVKPNLDQMNMEIDLSFSSLKIQGDFEVASSSVLHIMPLTSLGQFSLGLTDLKATGRVGLKLQGDTLSTINYDIGYKPADMFLTVWGNTKDGVVISTANTNNFEDTLLKKIDRELRYVLNKFLKKELDIILAQVPIIELIEDQRMINLYRAHVQEQRANANSYVDTLLQKARDYITDNNMQEIPIPGFTSSFSKKILFVTWYGEFSVSDGYLSNLATLKRTDDVSLSYGGNGSLTVFGSFGLEELKMGYESYVAKFMGFGPSGSLSVAVGKNSIFLKVTANLREGMSVQVDDVRVEHIEDVQIDITGLGILTWLISKIATWVVGVFNELVVDLVNSHIMTAISIILPNINPGLYFN